MDFILKTAHFLANSLFAFFIVSTVTAFLKCISYLNSLPLTDRFTLLNRIGTTANLGIMLHVLSNQTVQEIWKAVSEQVEPDCLHLSLEVYKGNTGFGRCLIASVLGSGASQRASRALREEEVRQRAQHKLLAAEMSICCLTNW